MSRLHETANPRTRRAFAHSALAGLAEGTVSREDAELAVHLADQTRKGRGSGFYNRLSALARHSLLAAELETTVLVVREPRSDEYVAPQLPIQIILPLDPERIARLEAKAEEYRERTSEYVAPDAPGYFANHSKLTVLQRVLDEGIVHSGAMMEEFYSHPGFDLFGAEEAIRIVSDYCLTGGQHMQGGTGLPAA